MFSSKKKQGIRPVIVLSNNFRSNNGGGMAITQEKKAEYAGHKQVKTFK